MSSQIIDFAAPSLQGGFPRSPESLPHGLISPPELVREMLAKEKVIVHGDGLRFSCWWG